MKENKIVKNISDVQQRIHSIIREINAVPALALAAAANPILALEDLGYEIQASARQGIEDRIRFGIKKAKSLKDLRARIFKAAGGPLNLESDEELRRVLGEELRLPLPPATYGKSAPGRPETGLVLPPQVGWGEQVRDPLEDLRDAHPIMPPLLEYRRLEASEPRLASRPLYEEVRQGKRPTPVTKIRGVVKSVPR